MFAPRAVFQELSKGRCYTIYQDPPTGQFYLSVDRVIYCERGQPFKAEVAEVFRKIANLQEQDSPEPVSRH